MAFRTGRYIEPELLDDEAPERAAASLRDLVRINRLLGGHRVLLDALRRCFRPDEAFTMLDVGAASGDAARLVREHFPRVRVTSVDYRFTHLDPRSGPCVVGDAFALPFRARAFDVVYCGLFLHHFADSQVTALLRSFGEIARGYVIANDLERHVLPYYFLPATRWLLGWDRITLHDGPISVQAGFTGEELQRLAVAAGLRSPEVRVYRPAFRLCLLSRARL